MRLLFLLGSLLSFSTAVAAQDMTLSVNGTRAKVEDAAAFLEAPDLFKGLSAHILLFPARLTFEQREAIAAVKAFSNPEKAGKGIPNRLGEIQISFAPGSVNCDARSIRGVTLIFDRGPQFKFGGPARRIMYTIAGGMGGINAMACTLGDGGAYGLNAEGKADVESGAALAAISWKVGLVGVFKLAKKG